MAAPPDPTPEVARARVFAARVRIAIAITGGVLLAVDPALTPVPVAAAVGFGVLALTGIVESLSKARRWLGLEEVLSCIAVITMVGFARGQVDLVSMLWLVAAASGMLARGGRVGSLPRVIVIATLLSPLVTAGVSAEALGFAFGSIALLMATGSISRETAALLARARHDAAHDSLTGLLARAAFRAEVDRVAQLVTPERPAALIALDLDDFGAVNKRLGHAAGDRLLEDAATAMARVLREHDVLGRLGGDEFAALVFTDEPEPVARRLMEAARSSGGSSACAGIAICPTDGDDAEGLLAAADVALRLTKRLGRARVGAYEGAPIGSSGRDGARAALERLCRGDGLDAAVQPIVDVEEGRVHAYEALARFAARGGHSPLHWFALADELGMRAELELACLRNSLALVPALPGDTLLTVNLSAPMLSDERALEMLASCASLGRVVIEVTEETLVRQGEATQDVIHTLRTQGVRFAVDDVGAGYSGLGQLAALRPDYVKIDRGLVHEIDVEPERTALVGRSPTTPARPAACSWRRAWRPWPSSSRCARPVRR